MTITDLGSASFTDQQWKIAHAIAQTLVQEDTDINELGKAIAYLRSIVNQSDATDRFFTYLTTLVRDGKQIGHSGKTLGYYTNIQTTCSDYLKTIPNPNTILHILGWVTRLMRYYKDAGVPIGDIIPPSAFTPESARQKEIAQLVESQDFHEGKILQATVTKINGNRVTYEILGTIKLTEREPRKASLLQEGQTVDVKIISLKEDGSIKSVKCAN